MPDKLNEVTLEFIDGYPNIRDWSVLIAYRGSIAHGTYMPNTDPNSVDDIDLMGITVPPNDFYYGLREFGSRGTQEIKIDPYDIVLYESRKAISLLGKGNPNIISLLWLPDEMYLDLKAAGSFLIESRRVFSTKAAYKPFRGYAKSQMDKMYTGAKQGYMGDKREALLKQFGYDTKNASHLIRLLRQGIEFLETGEIVTFRPDADELLEIKRGEWPLPAVRSEALGLEECLERAFETSKLPDAPDEHVVNKIAIEAVQLTREEQT